jgi:hypothetical protein
LGYKNAIVENAVVGATGMAQRRIETGLVVVVGQVFEIY